MHWLLDPITKHYADFKGRASRKEYWMFVLSFTIAVILWMVVSSFLPIDLFMLVLVVSILAVIVPSYAIQVRRLHDLGWSGWWILLNLIPFGGIVLIVLFCLPSQPGTNAYGPNPNGVGDVQPAPAMPVAQAPQVTPPSDIAQQ